MKNKVLAIVGPTASGKTNLSLLLARVFSLEIVSCDSVQVYREFNIGSAKPTQDELMQVPHHLIDVLSPTETMDAALYKKMAEQKILAIQQHNHIPVIVGGTGMYFNALYYGMYEGKTTDPKIKQFLRTDIQNKGSEVYYKKLVSIDPAYAAKIAPTDERRIARALEVYKVTGVPFSELHKQNKKLELNWLIWGLDLDRTELYDKINRRVDEMLQNGLLEETKTLMEKYGQDIQSASALSSLGYRHCVDYLNGNKNFEQMVFELKRDTRRFAKRQLTWFRKNKEIRWVFVDRKDEIIRITKEWLEDESGFSAF